MHRAFPRLNIARCDNSRFDYVTQEFLKDDMYMEQRDRPTSYFYKVEDIIILSELERGL